MSRPTDTQAAPGAVGHGAGERVSWGTPEYVAAADATDALKRSRRAGPAAMHTDLDATTATVADALLGLRYKTWDFGDSVAFEAMLAATEVLGHERWGRFAQGYGRAWATRAQPYVRLDCTVPGRALVRIAQRYDDSRLLERLLDLAGYLVSRPQLSGVFETWQRSPLLAPYSRVPLSDEHAALLRDPPPGVFLDCLHFDPPFLLALGRALGRDDLVEVAVTQALGYVELLQQPDGLFDHFVLDGIAGTFGPGWGRGQGWAALGLLEVLEDLSGHAGPLPDDARNRLTTSARLLLEQMVRLQRDDGHWFAVVSEPASGEEYSTAGFMAWALQLGLALGVVEGEPAKQALRRARAAVLSSLDAQGQLREVSAAVYASTEPTHYWRVPRGYVVPWGQGPALLGLLATVPGEQR